MGYTGFITPTKIWPYKWVTGVISLLTGVVIPFVTGRGAR